MAMKFFLIALLPFASQAEQAKCFSADIKTPDGASMTKDELLGMMNEMLGAAFVSVVDDVPKIKEFFKTRGNCQAECLQKVIQPALGVVYGKMGEKLMSEEGKNMAIEAITGSIRACYPSPPRSEIKKLATAAANGMGAPPKEGVGFPEGVKCANAGHESDFPMDDVLKAFGGAFEKTVNKNAKIKDFFENKALQCQLPCLEQSMSLTMKTLFLTDQQDKDVAIDALTGGMHACFPGVPSEEIEKLVVEVVGVLEASMKDASLRLYATNLIKFGSSNVFTLCGLVTSVTLVLFSAGVAVGRRWKRSNRANEVEMVGLIDQSVE